jgi:hypothetical protein
LPDTPTTGDRGRQSGIQSILRIFIQLRNREEYPRWNFALDILRDFVLIFAILVMVRLFRWGISALDKIIPQGHTPVEAEPYLPFTATRVFVTVLDSVSILTICIVGFFSIIKLFKEYFRGNSRNGKS